MAIKRVHKICGGEILNRKCQKCGQKFGVIKYFTTGDIEEKSNKFDPKEYRKRIGRGDDLL